MIGKTSRSSLIVSKRTSIPNGFFYLVNKSNAHHIAQKNHIYRNITYTVCLAVKLQLLVGLGPLLEDVGNLYAN